MRQSLHIPLSRHKKTTRDSQRVVWLRIGFLVVGTGLFVWFWSLWLTRNTVQQAAPEDTRAMIQLLVNKKTAPVLEKTLRHVPLITNRDLTYSDISPYIYGEFGWFFHEDGTSSVAIRSRKSVLPNALFDAKHLVVQQITPTLFLLSEKLQPVSGLRARREMTGLLPSFSARLGTYLETNNRVLQTITYSRQGIKIGLPNEEKNAQMFELDRVANDAILVLLLPVLANTETLDPMIKIFSLFVDPFLQSIDIDFIHDLFNNPGVLIVSGDQAQFFLLQTDQTVNLDTRMNLLRTSLALQSVKIQDLTLPDGSLAHEFFADPSLIPVEERTIEGKSFLRAVEGEKEFFASKDGDLILSNSDQLMRTWLNPTEKTAMLMPCDTNSGFIQPRKLLESTSSSTQSFHSSLFQILSRNFSFVGLNSRNSSRTIHLCY